MIRCANIGDVGDILAIWNAVIARSAATFTSDPKTHQTVSDLIETRPVFVADLDGSAVGFASFGPFRAGPGYRYVAEHTIYLAAEAQGQGLGRQLMAVLEESAKGQGIDTLIGGIGGENTAAHAFHAALGFHEVGRLPGLGAKFGKRYDLVLMQKNLGATP